MDPQQQSPANSSTQSLRDLIYGLRSAFSEEEFREAADVLLEREEQLKRQVTELQEEVESLEQERDFMFFDNLRLKDEVEKRGKEYDDCKDQIRVLELETSKDSGHLEKKEEAIEKVRKLNADYEKQIRVLKREKEEIEAQLRAYERRFAELDDRVLKLEKASQVLTESGRTKNDPKLLDITQIADDDDDDQQPISTLKRKQVSKESKRKSNGDDGNQQPISTLKRKQVSRESIRKSNGDDGNQQPISTLESKRTSREFERKFNGDDGNSMPIRMKKKKQLQELRRQPKAYLPSKPRSVGIRPCSKKLEQKNLQSSNCSSDSDNESIDDPFNSIIARMQAQNEGWTTERTLINELENDDLLCMDAICTIHRWRILEKQLPIVINYISPHDISRISELANILIDGDPQLKRKKAVSELQRSDVDDCRKLATSYSLYLFHICTKGDRFFPPRPPAHQNKNPKISTA